jgi:hypothetical protein
VIKLAAISFCFVSWIRVSYQSLTEVSSMSWKESRFTADFSSDHLSKDLSPSALILNAIEDVILLNGSDHKMVRARQRRPGYKNETDILFILFIILFFIYLLFSSNLLFPNFYYQIFNESFWGFCFIYIIYLCRV